MSEGKLPTLTEFFDQRFVPVWIKGKGLESMKLWNLYVGHVSMSEVDDLVIAKFIGDLSKHRGKKPGTTLKPSSIAKHCTQLDTIFKLTGPKTRSNRLGQRMILEPPFVDSPKVKKSPPKTAWNIDDMRAMYAKCDGMTKPVVEGTTTAHWWRTILTVGWFVGLRIFEMLHFTKAMIEGVWLTIADNIAKGGKGTRHYLHQEVAEHIKQFDRADDVPILLYPKWGRGRRLLYDYLRVLERSAGIHETKLFGFHGLRKAHINRLRSIQAPQLQALKTASRSVGHASSAVTVDHYVATDVEDQCVIDSILCMESLSVRTVEKVQRPERMDEIVRRALQPEREFID